MPSANMEDFAEAEAAYSSALARTPGDASIWKGRALNERRWGFAEIEAKREREARAHFERGLAHIEQALRLDPGNLNYLHMRADLLGHSRHNREAETIYLALLAHAPNDAEFWEGRAINEREWALAEKESGRVHEAHAHFQRGLAHIEQALRFDGSNPPKPQYAVLKMMLQGEF